MPRLKRTKKAQPAEGNNYEKLMKTEPQVDQEEKKGKKKESGRPGESGQSHFDAAISNKNIDPLSIPHFTRETIPERQPIELLFNRAKKKREEGILEPEKVIVFMGKRGTGKTFTLTWCMYKWWEAFPPYGLFPIAKVFTTTTMNKHWEQFVPKHHIHQGMPDIALKLICERQKNMLDWIAEDPTGERAKTVNPWLLVILDDTITADGFKHNKFLQEFAAMGRHLKIALMVTTQYPKAISTLMRENVDYVQVLFQRNIRCKESIAEDYLNFYHPQPGKNQQVASKVINDLTRKLEGEDHPGQFWVDNVTQSLEEKDILFTIKPDKPPHFQIGTPTFWDPQGNLDYEMNPHAFPYPPGFKHDLFEDLELGSMEFFEGYSNY